MPDPPEPLPPPPPSPSPPAAGRRLGERRGLGDEKPPETGTGVLFEQHLDPQETDEFDEDAADDFANDAFNQKPPSEEERIQLEMDAMASSG